MVHALQVLADLRAVRIDRREQPPKMSRSEDARNGILWQQRRRRRPGLLSPWTAASYHEGLAAAAALNLMRGMLAHVLDVCIWR